MHSKMRKVLELLFVHTGLGAFQDSTVCLNNLRTDLIRSLFLYSYRFWGVTCLQNNTKCLTSDRFWNNLNRHNPTESVQVVRTAICRCVIKFHNVVGYMV